MITNGVTALVTNVGPAEYLVTYTLNSATDSENLFMTRLWRIESIGDITGIAKIGSVLTAGALTPASGDVSYQWKICSTSGGQYTDIPLATLNTYTLVPGDEGKYIKVAATGTNSFTGMVASAATSAVAAADKAVVTFTKTPADLTLVVKSGADAVTAEADGNYKLAAGSYTYTATKDGYTTLTDVAFTVTPEDAAAGVKAVPVTMTVPTYAVTLGTITRVSGDTESTVTIDATPVETGKTVTLTVAPKAGMQLKAGTLVAGYNNGTSQTAVLAGAGPYTFTMPAYAVTVTAEFEAIPVPTYAVTLGTITRASGDTESTVTIDVTPVEAGKTVTLTVAPKTGMQLKAGTLTASYNNGTSKTAVLAGTGPYTFTMPAYAVTVTAEFEAIPVPTYAVTLGTITRVSGDTESTVTIDATPVEAGKTVTLTAVPKAGMQLKAGTLTAGYNNGTSQTAVLAGAGPYTFTMPAYAVTVAAEFEAIPVPTYAVTLGTITRASGDTESTVTIDATSVEAGKTVTLTVAPKAGMQLKAGTLTAGYNNGTSQTAMLAGAGPYTFTMPAYAVKVTAEFEAIPVVPVISAASASVSDATGNTTAKFVFTTDTPGTCYLVLYNAADSKPDAATIKNYYYDALMNYRDQITAGIKEISFNVGGLTPSTNYNAYVIVVDADGNTSAVTTIPIKTPAANIAAFTGAALTQTTGPDLSTVYVLTLTGMTGVDPNSTYDFTRLMITWADSTSTVINYKYYNKVYNFNGTSGTYCYDPLTYTLEVGFWNVSGTPGFSDNWDSMIKYLDVVNNNGNPNFTIIAGWGWNINPDNIRAKTISSIPGKILVPTATIGDIIVASTTREAITPKDVVITLANDTIKNSISIDTNLASWIVNLPPGLTAKAKETVEAGATTITITIAGTGTLPVDLGPARTIAITIPAASLASNVALTVAANTNAKFVSADTSLAVYDLLVQGLNNTSGSETIKVAANTTISGLKGAIAAADDSAQTYTVTNSSGAVKLNSDLLVTGDKLIVTAEAGAPTVTYVITVAP